MDFFLAHAMIFFRLFNAHKSLNNFIKSNNTFDSMFAYKAEMHLRGARVFSLQKFVYNFQMFVNSFKNNFGFINIVSKVRYGNSNLYMHFFSY